MHYLQQPKVMHLDKGVNLSLVRLDLSMNGLFISIYFVYIYKPAEKQALTLKSRGRLRHVIPLRAEREQPPCPVAFDDIYSALVICPAIIQNNASDEI